MSTTNRLPIGQTVGAVYEAVSGSMGDAVRVGWLPFLVLVVSDVAFAWLTAPPQPPAPLMYLLIFLIVAIWTAVALSVLVAWHRRVLLGPPALPPGLPLQLGRREGLYLARALLYAAVMAVIFWVPVLAFTGFGRNDSALFGAAGIAGMVVLWLIELYLLYRVSLAFPALALDRPMRIAEAWRMSAGNGLRLLAIGLMVISPVVIPQAIALAIPYFLGDTVGLLISRVIYDGLALAGLMLGASMLSIAFVELGGANRAEPDIAAEFSHHSFSES